MNPPAIRPPAVSPARPDLEALEALVRDLQGQLDQLKKRVASLEGRSPGEKPLRPLSPGKQIDVDRWKSDVEALCRTLNGTFTASEVTELLMCEDQSRRMVITVSACLRQLGYRCHKAGAKRLFTIRPKGAR